ncbi:MAG TPA: efflux RND transporter periplasmic adaptor subunit [Candidatus Acidoferrum sp.]|nr:efflux RND transporter periplasmic adaptor subunit [Candidatus Acidoferrum sp.]
MAKSRKRRKIVIFTIIAVVLLGLTALVVFRKRDIAVTVQTAKVIRTNLTEIVTANGKVQPVLQVKISAEVSGEIIDLPVKEGQKVTKGTLLVKIKPDLYIAGTNQAYANYKSAVAAQEVADANLRKADAEYRRNQDLFRLKLVSDSDFDTVKAADDVAKAQLESAVHQVAVAKAGLDSANESLGLTTIVAPLTGTISKLNSRLGERVLGTIQNVGTEIMTIADLNEMEARVDIGENDVVRIAPGQKAKLEVDAFKNRKFNGIVTDIANSAKDAGQGSSGQEATKFEVAIRIQEKEAFRPGMSVTAEVETCYRTNALAVPFASVTTRMPKGKDKDKKAGQKLVAAKDPASTNAAKAATNTVAVHSNAPASTNLAASSTNAAAATGTNAAKADQKSKEAAKPIEVVFVVEGDHAKMVPVKIGISDDNYWEITEGVTEGQEVVSGSFRAITRELEDGKKIHKGPATGESAKDKESKRAD